VLVEGSFIASTNEEGLTYHGMILSWKEQTVKVDFNHAMAGKKLELRYQRHGKRTTWKKILNKV